MKKKTSKYSCYTRAQLEKHVDAVIASCNATIEARDALAERVVELGYLNAKLRAELKALEAAFDTSQEHRKDALASAAKATKEALDWKRLADHWEKQWNASNSERGTNAIRVKELETELDRMRREHGEEVARLEQAAKDIRHKWHWSAAQKEAFEAIALAAVGVNP